MTEQRGTYINQGYRDCRRSLREVRAPKNEAYPKGRHADGKERTGDDVAVSPGLDSLVVQANARNPDGRHDQRGSRRRLGTILIDECESYCPARGAKGNEPSAPS